MGSFSLACLGRLVDSTLLEIKAFVITVNGLQVDFHSAAAAAAAAAAKSLQSCPTL